MELDYSEREDDTGSRSTARSARVKNSPPSTPLATFIEPNIPTTLEFEEMNDDFHSITASTLPETIPRSVGTGGAVFKVSDPSGNTHRIKCETIMSVLFDAIADKVNIPTRSLQLQYVDDEGDIVTMTCDDDVAEAWALARRTGQKVAKVSAVVSETKTLDPAILAASGAAVAALAFAGFMLFRPRGN